MWFLSSCAFPFAGLKRHPIHAAKSSWLLSVIKVPKYAAHRDSVVAKTRERLAQFAQLCSREPVLSRVTQITKKNKKHPLSLPFHGFHAIVCFCVSRFWDIHLFFSAASHASWRWRELGLWCSQQWKIAFKKFKRNCVSITLADPWTVSSFFFFFFFFLSGTTFYPKSSPLDGVLFIFMKGWAISVPLYLCRSEIWMYFRAHYVSDFSPCRSNNYSPNYLMVFGELTGPTII